MPILYYFLLLIIVPIYNLNSETFNKDKFHFHNTLGLGYGNAAYSTFPSYLIAWNIAYQVRKDFFLLCLGLDTTGILPSSSKDIDFHLLSLSYGFLYKLGTLLYV